MGFRELDVMGVSINPATIFGSDWPLLTAGTEEDGFNTMTIAWGHAGSVWLTRENRRPSLTVYVREARYTKEFMDKNGVFTVSVLPEKYRKELTYLGSVSGRDEDKVAKMGLTPVFDKGSTYFEEARLVFVCRKVYASPFVEDGFLDKDLQDAIYPEKDFHTVYVGQIMSILSKEEHFCTCTDEKCQYHPVNHLGGCDECIKKNLELGEVPACIWKNVEVGVGSTSDYSMGNFSKFFLDKLESKK